jgi:FkbM family methyltransferase
MYRSLFLAQARRETSAIAIAHPSGDVLVPSDDVSIRPKLFLDGTRGDLIYLQRAVELARERGVQIEGTTFLDIGANLGTTSLAAIREHAFGRVVACEPDPDNARYLRATASLNGLEEIIVVVEAAVSDRAGQAVWRSGRTSAEGISTGTGTLRLDRSGAGQVEVVALDDLVARGFVEPASVGMVWLDVQGFEGHALAGAEQVLAGGAPVVVAVRRRQLKRTDGRAIFLSATASHFVSFVDLREHGAPEWVPRVRPIGELVEVLAGPTTDVLLLA